MQFGFQTINNDAKYEALIGMLKLAQKLGATKIKVFNDSQLVVNQINDEYATKDMKILEYLSKVSKTLAFKEFSIK